MFLPDSVPGFLEALSTWGTGLVRSLGLFLFVFLIHGLRPVLTQGNSRRTILVALNLIHHGTFELGANEAQIVRSEFYGLECVFPDQHRLYPLRSMGECGGPARLYALYAASISVLALPMVAPLEWVPQVASPILLPIRERVQAPMIRAFLAGDLEHSTPLPENLVAPVFTALAAGVIYYTALGGRTPHNSVGHIRCGKTARAV